MRAKILYSFAVLALFSCNQPKSEDKKEIRGEAQGTSYQILYKGNVSESNLKVEIDSLLLAIDLSMSTWVKESAISQLNHSDSLSVDTMFKSVFTLSKKVKELSMGAFDPGIAPILEVWGFEYTSSQKIDSTIIDSLLPFSSIDMFALNGDVIQKKDQRARLSFNAVAQGYAVDLMAAVLESNNIVDYYVELGGELKVKGKNFDNQWWRIGIDKPSDLNLEHELSAIVPLQNQAMVTSGNYRKFVEIEGRKYSHSINPKTGFPVAHTLLSATIFSKQAAMADALATACMVLGLEKAVKLIEKIPQTEAIFILDNNGSYDIKSTKGIQGKFEPIEN